MAKVLCIDAGTLRVAMAALAALVLAGCLSDPGPHIGGSGQCRDEALGWAIGQVADEATMRRLLRESGAGLIDPLGPDSKVLADHRGDRLRVRIDADNRIQSARCE
ncbi:hypothetical protein [Luteimonas kalidii]|uniref:Peptidase inhibitor I78 family protein n=1 Tax=Luteimonas kalidii TaxID=3042025 RepID=A0ABT6JU00_9GAMM|nr:hypothetical protein [Luteimonas kalidii]MDH5834173.1 hypothetical protein [Luteimonas kalidii]